VDGFEQRTVTNVSMPDPPIVDRQRQKDRGTEDEYFRCGVAIHYGPLKAHAAVSARLFLALPARLRSTAYWKSVRECANNIYLNTANCIIFYTSQLVRQGEFSSLLESHIILQCRTEMHNSTQQQWPTVVPVCESH
jgi:hypothetical protein